MAQQADAMAKRRYSQARSKPQLRGEEMDALDALVTPLIKKGQPLTHIYAEHGGELPVSQRTLYNYIDSGTLSVGNLDLRRKVILYMTFTFSFNESNDTVQQMRREERQGEAWPAHPFKS